MIKLMLKVSHVLNLVNMNSHINTLQKKYDTIIGKALN